MKWKKFKRMVCFVFGHNFTTDHHYGGFASLDGYYTKAVCTQCGEHLTGRY